MGFKLSLFENCFSKSKSPFKKHLFSNLFFFVTTRQTKPVSSIIPSITLDEKTWMTKFESISLQGVLNETSIIQSFNLLLKLNFHSDHSYKILQNLQILQNNNFCKICKIYKITIFAKFAKFLEFQKKYWKITNLQNFSTFLQNVQYFSSFFKKRRRTCNICQTFG